jgi:hypothetical protein
LLALRWCGPMQRLDALDAKWLDDGAHTLSLAVGLVLSRPGRSNRDEVPGFAPSLG